MLIRQIGKLLHISEDKIDRKSRLGNLGVDSLMTFELIAAMHGEYGIPISFAELNNAPNISRLAEQVCARL